MEFILTFINMKKLLLLATISLVFISCKKESLTANGNMTTETRTLAAFTSLHNSGSTAVHVNYGNEYKVELRGSSNLIPYFKTTVSNGMLEVGYERVSVNHDDIEVIVTMPTLGHISLSGSSKVDINGVFPVFDFLKIDISGSGGVWMKTPNTANNVAIDISGSGIADLEKLTSKNAEASISGSGDTRIVVQERLKASISGSGQVYYSGNPIVDARISGSGKVIKF